MKLIEIYRNLFEDLKKWDTGRWVHYSDSDILKLSVNKSKRFHQDPIGIYLFPESFTPRTFWFKKEYKYIIELDSDIKVFDFTDLTVEKTKELTVAIDKMYGIDDHIKNTRVAKYDSDKYYKDIFWDVVRDSMSAAQATKFFMSQGYDAIFDDTMTIHSIEVQMIVFNVRKLNVIEVIKNDMSLYQETKVWFDKLMDDIKGMGYTIVEVSKLKASKSMMSGKDTIKGSIIFRTKPSDSYQDVYSVSVYSEDEVVNIDYSEMGNRTVATYNVYKKEWEWNDYEKIISVLKGLKK